MACGGPLATLVFLLACFHVAGSSLGFSVWPVGEARNWLAILQDGPGTAAPKIFWAIDGRNPLSPWWYVAARPIFDHLPQAFLLMQIAMSGLLGLSTYLLVYELSDRGNRRIAIAAGILTSLFIANIRLDGIHWNFVGATAATVLCIWTYLRYANCSSPGRTLWYGLSICLWLLAIGTYTIQSGAIIAVFLLAVMMPARDWRAKLATAVGDTVPYGIVIILFVLIWKTSEPGGITTTPLSPSAQGVLASISEGIWHSSYGVLWSWASSLSFFQLIVFFAVPALAAMSAICFTPRDSQTHSFNLQTVIKMGLVAVSVVMPTIALEGSGTMWGPGTRWPMVMQFWTPMFFLVVLSALTLLVNKEALRTSIWVGGISVMAGCSGAAFAGMNLNQVYLTATDRQYFAALTHIINDEIQEGRRFPRHYVIKIDPGVSAPSDYVSVPYSKTALPAADVGYSNLLPNGAGLPVKVESGVVTTISNAGSKSHPLPSVSFLSWDGQSMRQITPNDNELEDYPLNNK